MTKPTRFLVFGIVLLALTEQRGAVTWPAFMCSRAVMASASLSYSTYAKLRANPVNRSWLGARQRVCQRTSAVNECWCVHPSDCCHVVGDARA